MKAQPPPARQVHAWHSPTQPDFLVAIKKKMQNDSAKYVETERRPGCTVLRRDRALRRARVACAKKAAQSMQFDARHAFPPCRQKKKYDKLRGKYDQTKKELREM